jgi:membrane protein implicated in regulation of membrane protease activity
MEMILIWLGTALAAVVLELITPSALVSIWFALGAVVAALCAALQLSVAIQFIVFLLISVLAMLIVRPVASRYLRGNVVPTNADRMIDQTGKVTRTIYEDQWGEVYVLSSYWSAVSLHHETIEKGTKVKILNIEGAKLIVEPLRERK